MCVCLCVLKSKSIRLIINMVKTFIYNKNNARQRIKTANLVPNPGILCIMTTRIKITLRPLLQTPRPVIHKRNSFPELVLLVIEPRTFSSIAHSINRWAVDVVILNTKVNIRKVDVLKRVAILQNVVNPRLYHKSSSIFYKIFRKLFGKNNFTVL